MELEQRTLDRIKTEYAEEDRNLVIHLLSRYSGKEQNRVIWDILELSRGRVKEVKHYVTQANMDYRDVLYWAEYYGDSKTRKP